LNEIAGGWESLDRVVKAFEDAWQSGGRPDLGAFLVGTGEARRALLAELAHVDLERRLKAGDPARAEDYLRYLEDLTRDAEVIAELAEFESRLLRLLGQPCAPPDPQSGSSGHGQGALTRLASQPGSVGPAADRVGVSTASPTTAEGATRGGERPVPAVPGYEVLGLLGRGGMGVVYRARQTSLNRVVALKMILPDARGGQETLDRFKAEAESVARLNHPNIVQIFEVGEHAGVPYFSLEYCPSGSLDRKLAGTPMRPEEAAALVDTLARAIEAAHAAGVVHRDLKPANVLLDADGRPKVADFGLAKRLDESGRTHNGALLGTPSYMAPEQVPGYGKGVGPATDVYALGSVLYECLTGRPPFKGAGTWDTVQMVVTREPVPVRSLNPKVPRDLETVCLKCLEKNPGKRYGSAAALAEDLTRYRTGKPVEARPTGPVENAARWARRHPARALLAIAAVALLATGVAAVGLYAELARRDAEQTRRDLDHLRHTLTAQEEARLELDRGRDLEARGDSSGAREVFARVVALLNHPEEAAPPDLLAEAGVHLEQATRAEREKDARAVEEKHWEAFQRHYDEALFNEAPLTDPGPAEGRSGARDEADRALAEYGLAGNEAPAAALEKGRPYRTPQRHAELGRACYELLILRARSEADDGPGDGRARAARALLFLERAAELGRGFGFDSQTLRDRRSAYRARAEGRPEPAAAARAGAGSAADALDSFLSGLEAYQAGRYGEASRSCAAAVRRRPGPASFWAQYVAGMALIQEDSWLEARDAMSACLNLRPGFVWPLLLRGFAAGKLGYQRQDASELAAARDDLDRVLKEAADPRARYVALATRGALAVRRAARRGAPAGGGAAGWAILAARLAEYAGAVRDLKEAIRLNAGAYPAHASLAVAYDSLGETALALAEVGEAIRRAPKLAPLYEQRGLLLQRGQDFDAAAADFERAAGLHERPDRRAAARLLLGRLHLEAKDYRAALADCDAALAADPAAAEAFWTRALVLWALKNYAAAGLALDRYLAAEPGAPAAAWKARGLIHLHAGEYTRAAEAFTIVLRLTPGDDEARRQRGWAYLQADAPKLAAADFDAVLGRDADDASALCGRGTVLARLGRHREAAAAAEQAERAAERRKGPDGNLLYQLVCLYARVVGQLESTPLSRDGEAARGEARYRQRGLDLLRRTLEAQPAAERAAFWEARVQKDPELAPLRRGSLYASLAAEYRRGP
jgi:lipoprotein NlpI